MFALNAKLIGVLLLSALSLSGGLAAAKMPTTQQDPTQILMREILEHNRLMPNLEEMCDGIGPRMTGSSQLRKAQAWAMKKLVAYGAVNVHEEAYELGRPWFRGKTSARLLNANGQRLNIEQKAWTEGSKKTIRAEVAILDVKTIDEFRAIAPSLRNKIVLIVSPPQLSASEGKTIADQRAEIQRIVHETPFAAVLQISENEHNLQHMWGYAGTTYQERVGLIVRSDAALLQRLIARGVTPKLAVELGGGFGANSVKAYNVVADIPGSELANEMVIIGAHQDSWDLSTGATDNGAGVVGAMEVLRAMHATGLKPKRSLRIVLFSGEEQGLLGSKAYVQAHQAEMKNIQAALVQDSGTGRILGFVDMKVETWFAALSAAVAPAASIGPIDISYGVMKGSDQASFFEQGIPAFGAVQEPLDYRSHTHHTEWDSVDRVRRDDLIQATQVMAVTAWGLLNGERIPQIESKLRR